MFGVNAPHKRGYTAPTGPRPGHSDEEFEPDSQADRDHRAKMEKIREAKKREKALLQERSSVAGALLAGGKMSIDAAGIAVMSGGITPASMPAVVGHAPSVAKPPDKKEKKDKKKEKDKKKKDKKKKEKKKTKDKKKTKKKQKKSSSSSSSSSGSS